MLSYKVLTLLSYVVLLHAKKQKEPRLYSTTSVIIRAIAKEHAKKTKNSVNKADMPSVSAGLLTLCPAVPPQPPWICKQLKYGRKIERRRQTPKRLRSLLRVCGASFTPNSLCWSVVAGFVLVVAIAWHGYLNLVIL